MIKFKNEQLIKEQNEQIKTLSESTKLKMREGTNLKALCQMILDQRSDIEQFFLEALEQVKEEKRRKLEQEKQAEVMRQRQIDIQQQLAGGMLNYIHKEEQAKKEKVTIELSDLDWEDRERILRLLFSKMNTGQGASNWRDTQNS